VSAMRDPVRVRMSLILHSAHAPLRFRREARGGTAEFVQPSVTKLRGCENSVAKCAARKKNRQARASFILQCLIAHLRLASKVHRVATLQRPKGAALRCAPGIDLDARRRSRDGGRLPAGGGISPCRDGCPPERGVSPTLHAVEGLERIGSPLDHERDRIEAGTGLAAGPWPAAMGTHPASAHLGPGGPLAGAQDLATPIPRPICALRTPCETAASRPARRSPAGRVRASSPFAARDQRRHLHLRLGLLRDPFLRAAAANVPDLGRRPGACLPGPRRYPARLHPRGRPSET
jgi:hypothetical protein